MTPMPPHNNTWGNTLSELDVRKPPNRPLILICICVLTVTTVATIASMVVLILKLILTHNLTHCRRVIKKIPAT